MSGRVLASTLDEARPREVARPPEGALSSPVPMKSPAADIGVRLDKVAKVYGGLYAVQETSLHVRRGEFLTLLGPSGSGKTTTLMMIAGFVTPSQGRIIIDGKDVTDQPPYRRDIGVVFQSYALFPHLTVARNVAFPLEARGLKKSEIEPRVRKALDLVKLGAFAERYPAQLSGGQQQRVALARCIASESPVILLDEPLSNLDARLRLTMRGELRDLQRRLGTTMIFVTHDQEEAMSLADRIFLFNSGRIEQAGPPLEIYRRPRTRYAAEFFGKVNFVPVEIGDQRNGLRELRAPNGIALMMTADAGAATAGAVLCAIRPEAWRIVAPSPQSIPGRILDVTHLGDRVELRIDTPLGAQLVTQLGGGDYAIGETVALDPRPGFIQLIDDRGDPA